MTFDHESLAILGEMPATRWNRASRPARFRPAARPGRDPRGAAGGGGAAEGQLPVSSPALHRPDAQAAASGRPGSPMPWRCSSTRTTTPSTAAGPPRRWRRRPSPGSPRCSAGRRTWATSAAGGRWRTSRPSGSGASCVRARRWRPRRRPITPTRGSRPSWASRSGRSPSTPAAGWMSSALEDALASGEIGTVVVTLGTTAAGTVDPLPAVLELRDRHDFRDPRRRGLRRILHAGGEPRARGPGGVRPHRRGRFDRHRPAQARAPAVWLRLRAVPRPGRRPVLPARLAVHVLQLGRAAPGRDLAGMLAGRGLGGGTCGRRCGCCRPSRAALRPRARIVPRGGPDPPPGARGKTTASPRSSRPSWISSSGPSAPRRPASPRREPAGSSTPRPSATSTWPWPPSRGRCSKPPGPSRTGMPTRSSASAPAP